MGHCSELSLSDSLYLIIAQNRGCGLCMLLLASSVYVKYDFQSSSGYTQTLSELFCRNEFRNEQTISGCQIQLYCNKMILVQNASFIQEQSCHYDMFHIRWSVVTDSDKFVILVSE
jgi:hypothetical protein